jgi:hypothetical protein
MESSDPTESPHASTVNKGKKGWSTLTDANLKASRSRDSSESERDKILNPPLPSGGAKSSAHSRSPSENCWIAAKTHVVSNVFYNALPQMLTSITAIIFQPKQEEVVSACTSLLMTVEQRLYDENNAAALCPPTTVRDQCSLAFWF